MGDDNRHEMMESLFGAESGESDEEPEAKPSYSTSSNSANSGRDDEGEGEGEGRGEAEVESDFDGGESERAGSDAGRDVESEAERGGPSDRDEASDRDVGEGELSVSGSETYHRGGQDYEEHEVEQAREASDQGYDDLGDDQGSEQGLEPADDDQVEHEHEHEHGDDEHLDFEQAEDEPGEDEPAEDEQIDDERGDEDEQGENDHIEEEQEVDDEQQASGGVAQARDVFGDSDEDDEEVVRRQRSKSREVNPLAISERAQSEGERSDQEGGHADEFVGDDEAQYESDDYRQAERKREKPVGPPLEIEVPLKPPPGRADQLNLVRISNIMDIESKPFDPKTYEEESTFVTDSEGRRKRLRLEENVARWRVVHSRDGSVNYESNARFVKWSDGSMQLLLGNEVLDLSVQNARHDQSHLFIRHPKSLLQSQGRLLRKMKFMPSSLSSKSHKLLTALVDSRNKKVLKVKSVVTNFDPDKEKEVQEKAVEQRIKSKSDLQRKQGKMSRKFRHMPSRDREELSIGLRESALDEDEDADVDRGGRRDVDSRRFQEQLDSERGAERRILNAKRQPPPSRTAPMKDKQPAPSRREMLEDDSEEEAEVSAYETDPGEDDGMDLEEEREFDDEEVEDVRNYKYSDKGKNVQERRRNNYDDKKRRRDLSKEPELSPPGKSTQRRRVVVSDDNDDY